jgi:hypothetical protein
MSKISEQKALETYPILFSERNGYDNTFKDRRESYIKGYNQAFQDFVEKAERWLEIHMPFGEVSHESVYDCVQGFKNYMQNE